MTTIIVPIYNAAAALSTCLHALGRHNHDDHVLLIDDASTDPSIEPLLKDAVDRHAAWDLILRPHNGGFVSTANLAFTQTQGDVILLNSDTVVTSGWRAALERAGASSARVATVTPWSNNAEICSIPKLCVAAEPPFDPDAIAIAMREIGRPHYPELPTAVGFCMWMSRQVLDEMSGFDSAFGLGYGEENDFCRRAIAAGYTNVLCDDAYVVHLGNQSFGPRGLGPGGEAARQLTAKHGDYDAIIAQFIQHDPLAARRHEIVSGLAAAGIVL